NLESAWVPSPTPAIFSGQEMEDYLQWLPASRMGSIAGSFSSENIEDYYNTPFEIGYGRHIDWNHDFIGKDALKTLSEQQHRQKVSVERNAEDLAAAQRPLYEEGTPVKYISLPHARYGRYHVDEIERVG